MQDIEENQSSDSEWQTEARELWSSKQRGSSRIHEISYRACFKPELPEYFINAYSKVGDTVLDPFAGRGTTAIQSALMSRRVQSNDINPLSAILARGRLYPPKDEDEVEQRLSQIPKKPIVWSDPDLDMFFQRETLVEILGLREYFLNRRASGLLDELDEWILMVAISRLTGHSPGFFSVYTLPPNQAVSRESQKRINLKRNQEPTYRDTHKLILKKSKQLVSDLTPAARENLKNAGKSAMFFSSPADALSGIENQTVQLIVTSPPFLDIVQYADDNWLRAWFAGIDMDEVAGKITMARTLEQWSSTMFSVLLELKRVLKVNGYIAFEVGEIRKGKLSLEHEIIGLGQRAGLKIEKVLINTQEFTKTANIWGIGNNVGGTNTNRIVVLKK